MNVTPLARPNPVVPAIHQALRRGVDEEVFPGGAAAVYLQGRLVHLSATGDAQLVPERVPAKPETVFDLASLTKVLATTAALATLLGRHEAELDDPVVRHWPEFGRHGKDGVTLRHLLAHASGLPAWKPFFLDVMRDVGGNALYRETPASVGMRRAACRRGRGMVLERVCATELEAPPGTRAIYSDLGYMALGEIVERISALSLDRLAAADVYPKLGLQSVGFRPLDERVRRIPIPASTGVRRPREPAPGQESFVSLAETRPNTRPGEVDDDNAFAMGGVSGHAGLFGNARDVAAFGDAILEELDGASRIAPAEIWRELVRRDPTPSSSRALGFDTPSGDLPAAGCLLARSRTIGHTGFTGTSLWIDLDRRLSIALLTNRVHPSRANVRITAFRPVFHDSVVQALGLAAT